MSRNMARLLRQDLAAISDGLKSCSTVTSEKIRSSKSERDLLASASSICSRVFPCKFIASGDALPSCFFPSAKKRTRATDCTHDSTLIEPNRHNIAYFRSSPKSLADKFSASRRLTKCDQLYS